MRNSESAHLFTYNYFWKLVSISIISAVLFLHLFNTIRTNKTFYLKRSLRSRALRDGSFSRKARLAKNI